MHITYQDLHQYSQGKLGRFRGFVIENHLHGCALCRLRVEEVLKLASTTPPVLSPAKQLPLPSPKDRRRETRIPTDDPAQLQVISPFSSDRIAVRITDVSKSGMQLRLDAALNPGSTVKIRLRGAIVFAEIRHCHQISATEHRAGLLLQEVVSGNEIVRMAFSGE